MQPRPSERTPLLSDFASLPKLARSSSVDGGSRELSWNSADLADESQNGTLSRLQRQRPTSLSEQAVVPSFFEAAAADGRQEARTSAAQQSVQTGQHRRIGERGDFTVAAVRERRRSSPPAVALTTLPQPSSPGFADPSASALRLGHPVSPIALHYRRQEAAGAYGRMSMAAILTSPQHRSQTPPARLSAPLASSLASPTHASHPPVAHVRSPIGTGLRDSLPRTASFSHLDRTCTLDNGPSRGDTSPRPSSSFRRDVASQSLRPRLVSPRDRILPLSPTAADSYRRLAAAIATPPTAGASSSAPAELPLDAAELQMRTGVAGTVGTPHFTDYASQHSSPRTPPHNSHHPHDSPADAASSGSTGGVQLARTHSLPDQLIRSVLDIPQANPSPAPTHPPTAVDSDAAMAGRPAPVPGAVVKPSALKSWSLALHAQSSSTPPGAVLSNHGTNYGTVDWFQESDNHRQRQSTNRLMWNARGVLGSILSCYDAMQGWIVLILVGACTGLTASCIDILVEWLSDIKQGFCSNSFWLNHRFCCADLHIEGGNPCQQWVFWNEAVARVLPLQVAPLADVAAFAAYVSIAMGLAVLVAWLVQIFAPSAAGSGIPEVKTILSGYSVPKFLGPSTLLIKSTGLVLAVSSGLMLGKEGPLVHVACCWASVIAPLFSKYGANEAKKREILSAAAAVGISTAFGAPIGGVLFSLEEVSSYFPPKTMWRSFFCAVTGALVIHFMNPMMTGKLVLFEVSFHQSWHWFEVPLFILLGCFGGAMGGMVVRVNEWWSGVRKAMWVHRHPVVEVFIVAAITAVINYTSHFLEGRSTELLAILLNGCNPGQDVYDKICLDASDWSTVNSLSMAGSVKLLLFVITLGIKVPAGSFVPPLTVGACYGRVVGTMVRIIQRVNAEWWVFSECKADSCVTPGIYAIVGAAAFLAGTTRMTVSLVVIMLEITGGLGYVLPMMVAVTCSRWLADAISPDSLSDLHIRLNEYPYLTNKDEVQIDAKKTACHIMTKHHLATLTCDGTLAHAEELLLSNPYRGFPVVNSHRDLLVVGYMDRAVLENLLNESRFRGADGNARLYLSAEHEPSRTRACSDRFRQTAALEPPVDGTPDKQNYVAWSDYLDKSSVMVNGQMALSAVVDMFRVLGLRYCLVTHHGRLIGIIKKKDLVQRIQQHLLHTSNTGSPAPFTPPPKEALIHSWVL